MTDAAEGAAEARGSDRGGDSSGPSPSPGGSTGTPAGTVPECTEERRNDRETWRVSYDVSDVTMDPWTENDLLRSYPGSTDDDTRYVLAVDRDCDGNARTPPRWVPEPEGGEDGLAEILAARGEALARVRPDPPTPSLAPPDGAVLAGLPAWLWVDSLWEVQVESATTPGGMTVAVGVEPEELVWSTPAGDHLCQGPGIPWSSAAMADYRSRPDAARGTGDPECAVVFTDATGEPVTTEVAVRYRVWWTQNGGVEQPLPALTLTSDLPLEVGQRRAVRTR